MALEQQPRTGRKRYTGYRSFQYLEAGIDYTRVQARPRSRARAVAASRGVVRARDARAAPARRVPGHLVARPRVRRSGRCRPDLRVSPRGSRLDRLRGAGGVRHRRHFRLPDGRHRVDHVQGGLEVGRHHLGPGHAPVRHRPPGDGHPRRDDARHPARQGRRPDRVHSVARSRHADRERDRSTRHPVRPGRPLVGHRLQRGEHARLRPARTERRWSDRVRTRRRAAHEQARHRHRRVAFGRSDVAGHHRHEQQADLHHACRRARAVADQTHEAR